MLFNIPPRSPTKVRFASRARRLICLPLVAAMLFESAGAHVATPVDPVDPLKDLLLREEFTLVRPKAKAQALTSSSECRLDEFTSAEEGALLELIDSLPVECMDDWFFDDMPVSRADVFSEQNMIFIAESAVQRAGEYDSTQGRNSLTGKLYVFLYAGYWNYINYRSHFDIPDGLRFPVGVHIEIVYALQAFIKNTYFYDDGEEHSSMLLSVAHLISLMNLGRFFFFEFSELLINRRAYAESEREWELVSAILALLWSGWERVSSDNSNFDEAFLTRFAEALVDIGVSDQMLNTSSDRIFGGLVWVLRDILYSHGLEYPALLSVLKTNLRRMVNHWENFENVGGRYYNRLYAAIGIVVSHYRRNHTQLTDLMEEFLIKILPSKYFCGGHIVRSQYESPEHREEVCRTLAYQEELFHSVLDTNRQPVPDDFNEFVEIIIFNNVPDISRSLAVFGAGGTGLYHEGDPGDRYNIARAFVYMSDSFFSLYSSLILRHEFIHYLDGRYNKYGSVGRWVPWSEGLATYLSSDLKRIGPLNVTREANMILSRVFGLIGPNVADYNVQYSVIRFMFERHPEDVAEFLDYFYKGDYDGYRDYVRNTIGSRYDSEFADWLATATKHNNPFPRIKRKRPGTEDPNTEDPEGVCDRTPQVRDAIVQALEADGCAAVDAEALAGVARLNLGNQQLTALQAGDFDGLTGLQALWLHGNHLVGLTRADPSLAGLPGGVQVRLGGQAEPGRLVAAVPLMMSASDSLRQGFVRIINESDEAGMVRILAFDDGGAAAEAIEVQLGANQALHFNSQDLENGNAAKGISAGLGSPAQGDWRLDVKTALDVRVLAYIRTSDGFLTAMHDLLPREGAGGLAAQTFNPGQNNRQVSRLRLVNTGANAESLSIAGVDDQGSEAGPVALTLAAGEARTLSAFDLENGAQGLTGTLGDGAGKWRLFITGGESVDSVVGLSLLEAASGHLTNLSTTGVANAERFAAAVPLMLSAYDWMGQGFVRVINESSQSGAVRILAFDDGGAAANPIEIELGARQALHFNSNDLENGNAGKGIDVGIGPSTRGDWRLGVETALEVRAPAFVRTNDGFLTAMHDRLPRDADGRLAAHTFNPGQNNRQVSHLRLVNTGANAESLSISGVDDQGSEAGPVTLTLAAGESRTLSAQDLENGAQGLTGTLGDGAGKWRLFITAGEAVVGMSLLRATSGHLTNLSTAGIVAEGQ